MAAGAVQEYAHSEPQHTDSEHKPQPFGEA
jgi:hypothetical protein